MNKIKPHELEPNKEIIDIHIEFIERLIDQKGVEHFDLQMVTKARDMVESDFPPVKETVGDNEPPF